MRSRWAQKVPCKTVRCRRLNASSACRDESVHPSRAQRTRKLFPLKFDILDHTHRKELLVYTPAELQNVGLFFGQRCSMALLPEILVGTLTGMFEL